MIVIGMADYRAALPVDFWCAYCEKTMRYLPPYLSGIKAYQTWHIMNECSKRRNAQ
jgi:hypothetical protein